ncbi:MAG: GntR family transcriptional regulator [Acidimicrobiia bacterium]
MFSVEKGAPTADAVQWSTKTEVAYVNLRHQLLDGRLAPGAVLDQEALARGLGLSTTPVREALRRLEAEGLLLQVAHRAVRVPELSRQELEDLYSIRLQLDPWAAQQGAERAGDAERAELRQMATVDEDGFPPRELLVRNRQLHRIMYTASGNVVLSDLLDGLWDRCDRYRMVLLSDASTAHAAGAEHRRIVDAFCKRKVDRLGELLTRHLTASYDTLRARLR